MDLPKPDHLELRANRVREKGRPNHPKDLDFEVCLFGLCHADVFIVKVIYCHLFVYMVLIKSRNVIPMNQISYFSFQLIETPHVQDFVRRDVKVGQGEHLIMATDEMLHVPRQFKTC